jgi:hypothetical protein
MKPRELYSGNAPTAMGQMGTGLMEAGANIGRSLQQGYSAMGQGIAQGIGAAAQAYGDYKQAKTSNDITRAMINDPEYGKMLGLDPTATDYEDKKKKMLGTLEDTIKAHGQIGGSQFSKQYLGPIQEYAAIGRSYKQQMDMAKKQAEVMRTMPFYNMGAAALAAQMQDGTRPSKAVGGVSGGAPTTAPVENAGAPQAYGGYSTGMPNEAISPYGTSSPGPSRANPKNKSYEEYYGLPNPAENTNVDFGMHLFPSR